MKKLILLLTIINCQLSIINCTAQSISPEVIASAGTHYTGSNAQLSWTVGEPVITTVSNGSNIITQGFHQTLLTITTVEEQSSAGISINVYPNPVSDLLNISFTNNLKDLQLELFDMNGKLLQTSKIGSAQSTTQVSMLEYARANYLLRIYATDGSTNYTYKIAKMNAH